MTFAQEDSVYVETAAQSTANRQLDSVYVETAAQSTAKHQLDSVYVEVLSFVRPAYIGWGQPL